MADKLTIYDATLACHQVFRDLGAIPALEEWAENCLADLNLWADGAGALKVGKASLDARLSSNLDAKMFVVNLLRMLQAFAEKCVELGSGDTPETSVELSQAKQDIKYMIGQVSRITTSIRKAGTNARIQKADSSYDRHHPQIEALSQHLQLLLLAKPSKNGTLQAKASSQDMLLVSCIDDNTVADSHSLTAIQQRLIEANLKRRNRFLYARRHAMKMSERDQVPSTSIRTPQRLPQPPVRDALKRTTEKHEVPRVYSTTTATEVQDPIPLPTQASAQPASTVISVISSRVTYPRPPPLSSDQNVFQCPCCYQTLPTSMSGGSQWRKHLSKDVLPYTCILEDCPYPERLYQTKDHWLSHMFTDHGGLSHWACLACNDFSERPVFYDKSAFTEHLEERHSRGIKPHQIPMLVSAWQRKTSVSIHSCPLCGFEDQDSDAVLNHAAEHLHSFSLRSLPWAPGEDESGGDLYDGYYEGHPYFDTRRSVDTESERSRSTTLSGQTDLEELPAIGSAGETTENNRLTEENILNLLKNSKVGKDMLDAFLNEDESFQELSPLASADLESKYRNQVRLKEGEELFTQVMEPRKRALLTSMALSTGAMTNLEEAIQFARQGVAATLDNHPEQAIYLINLGICLHDRYSRTGSIVDLEEAIQVTQQAINLTPVNHPEQAIYLNNFGICLYDQYSRTGSIVDLEEAIQVTQEAISITPKNHPDHAISLNNLGIYLRDRYSRTGSIVDLEKAIEVTRQATDATPDDHPHRAIYLNNLGICLRDRYSQTIRMTDLIEAIQVTQEAIDLTADNRPDKAIYLNNLRNHIDNRLPRTRAGAVLEEAIQVARQAVNATPTVKRRTGFQSILQLRDNCHLREEGAFAFLSHEALFQRPITLTDDLRSYTNIFEDSRFIKPSNGEESTKEIAQICIERKSICLYNGVGQKCLKIASISFDHWDDMADALREVRKRTDILARGYHLLALKARADELLPHDLRITFHVNKDDKRDQDLPLDGSGIVQAGDHTMITLHNHGDAVIYVSVFDVNAAGKIAHLSRSSPNGIRLESQEAYALGVNEFWNRPRASYLKMSWPQGFPADVNGPIPESFVCMVTSEPVDLRDLSQQRRGERRSDPSQLEKLAYQLSYGQGRDAASEDKGRTIRWDKVRVPFLLQK